MSLFPAYSDSTTRENKASNEEKKWLSNNSFGFSTSVSSSIERKDDQLKLNQEKNKKSRKNRKLKKNKKWKKSKRRRKRKAQNIASDGESNYYNTDSFFIDRIRHLNFLQYKTLTKPLKPRYVINFKKGLLTPDYQPEFQKKKINRYFNDSQKDIKNAGISILNELVVIKKAEEFNKKLNEESDIADWLEFTEFQDEFFESQHIFYKSEKEKKRGISQRKMSILEKAMSYNPKNEKLQKLWLEVANEVLPPDELLKHIEKILEQTPENLSLWLSLISIVQLSLALCTFPSVTSLYKKAFNALQKTNVKEGIERDKNLIELLYYYGKFLDQSGHWEILWAILKSNLHLNFGKEFDFDLCIKDERLKEIEDTIISNNNQPIWVIWNRLETMREGVHFLPIVESIDYPQRCVCSDDIIDFVIHFHRETHFKLIVVVILLLKVPLLPWNYSLLKELLKNELIWTQDSPELTLSSVFHSPALDLKFYYLRHISQICRGPQYLKNLEGQAEFLELIQKTFEECIKLLQGKQRDALAVWWLRFNRWLCILDRHKLGDLNFLTRKMKNFFKNFMKNEENRDNLLFYCEYGLFEYNQGNIEGSIKILRTLISSRPPINQLINEDEKAVLCFIYKNLFEIYIGTKQNENAINLLINLGIGESIENETNADSVALAYSKYKSLAIELINGMKNLSPTLEELLMPQFSLEWLSCFFWLLALTQNFACMMDYANEVQEILSDNNNMFSNYAREYLMETTSAINWILNGNSTLFTQFLKNSHNLFPNNLNLLSSIASKRLDDHGHWLNFKQSFLNPPTIFGYLFLVSVMLERREVNHESFSNRLRSLFREITLKDGKLSSILHSLRLRFLNEYYKIDVDAAHLNAIEACPWNKSVYMNVASVLPNKLMQLTDVMIEKELRIHVTPDEIQEMRD